MDEHCKIQTALRQGMQKGFEQGREQGREEERKTMIDFMIQSGMSIQKIAIGLGVDEEVIVKIVNKER